MLLTQLTQTATNTTFIVNPQIPSHALDSTTAYLNPLPRNVANAYFPDYFFVNELRSETILTSLRSYKEVFTNCILNFRCSIVREISLAFLLGYQRIIITGLDPSSPAFWYTNQDARLRDGLSDVLLNLLDVRKAMSATSLDGRTRHEGEMQQGQKTNIFDSQSYCIWFTLRMLISLYSRNQDYKPEVIYLGSDYTCHQYIQSLDLQEHVLASID